MNKANHDRTNTLQKGLKALDRQMLSYIVPPIMFPVHGFPGFCLPRVRNAEMLKEPMPEVELEDVLPRELPRLRPSALTGGKQYGSVMDVLQIVYGQDFGAILKDYVDTHQEELYKKGIMSARCSSGLEAPVSRTSRRIMTSPARRFFWT
jgi:hypothetical protein